jgi:hypothetical protein
MTKNEPAAATLERDSAYTRHEHEELQNLVSKGREQLRIRLSGGGEANPPAASR